jgi:type II secretory ATPase GspE/PulE/Tfp pilus assembly ATPase PilB-like protein
MRYYGWHKVMQGLTTIEEIIAVTSTDIQDD